MNCPTCGHALHELGCKVTGGSVHLCPRCGTSRTCDGVLVVPVLVTLCRKFEREMKKVSGGPVLWAALGIAECINLPEDRPQ